MATRLVTGTLRYANGAAAVGARVKFRPRENAYTTSPSETVPAVSVFATADANGDFSVSLVSGLNTVYIVTLPDDSTFEIAVPDGSAVDLEALRAAYEGEPAAETTIEDTIAALGFAALDTQEDNVSVVGGTTALDFDGDHFDVSNAGSNRALVALATDPATAQAATDAAIAAKVAKAGDTMTGPLTFVGGTAGAGSWSKFQDGVLLTTPELGAVEFDDGRLYVTPNAGNRAQIETVHRIWQDADYTGANSNTAQKIFNESTNGAITLPASGKYELDAAFHIHTTGTTSHDFRILFGGTATLIAMNYLYFATLVATETGSSPALGWITSAAEATLAAAAASATHHTVLLKGVVEVNAGGTFIPQYRWSAAPGVAGVTLRGSFLKLTPLGPTTVGNWS